MTRKWPCKGASNDISNRTRKLTKVRIKRRSKKKEEPQAGKITGAKVLEQEMTQEQMIVSKMTK